MRWNFLHHLSSMHTSHKHTTNYTLQRERRKMAQACRNDNDKGEHFTCSNTTHTEHTPLPHSQHTAHKAVRQIEKWFISHKHSHPAPYAKWSEQICLSIALLRHRRAHLPTIQHELSLHSQTLHCPAIASLPHRTWLSLNMLGFRLIILLLCRTGLRSLLSLFKILFRKTNCIRKNKVRSYLMNIINWSAVSEFIQVRDAVDPSRSKEHYVWDGNSCGIGCSLHHRAAWM